jgi:endonuclease YncB( thermonuclease family)
MDILRQTILTACFLIVPLITWADSAITGPISAKVIKVYDGDTFTVEAYPWPGLEAKASVRVNGVDTPEIRGKCPEEKQKAIEARDFVRDLILGETVFLRNVKHGKYAGRVVAEVILDGGENLADKIISQGIRPRVSRWSKGRMVYGRIALRRSMEKRTFDRADRWSANDPKRTLLKTEKMGILSNSS